MEPSVVPGTEILVTKLGPLIPCELIRESGRPNVVLRLTTAQHVGHLVFPQRDLLSANKSPVLTQNLKDEEPNLQRSTLTSQSIPKSKLTVP